MLLVKNYISFFFILLFYKMPKEKVECWTKPKANGGKYTTCAKGGEQLSKETDEGKNYSSQEEKRSN